MRAGSWVIAPASIALAVCAAGCGGSSSRGGGATTTAALSSDLAAPGSLGLPRGDWTIGPVTTGDEPLPSEPLPPQVTPPPATPRHWYVGDAVGGELKTHSPAEEKKAMALLALVNQARKGQRLRPLAFDAEATKAAKAHAEDMLGRAYLGLSTPEGLSTADRLRLLGVTGFDAATEVVAAEPAGPCGLALAVKGWLASGPSREALLSSAATHLGVGVASPEGKQGQLSAVVLQRGGAPIEAADDRCRGGSK